jgi:UDP-N-acetylmuramoyl-tripeptide--D-alanyl-D-alanine ligase
MITHNQLMTQSLNLLEVAEKLDADICNQVIAEHVLGFSSLSIDSRTIKAGDLYVAIRGDKYDGHDFAKEAMDKGAVACVVEDKIDALEHYVQLVVSDTTRALGKIASIWRDKFHITLIAITGSCGKTTLKEMLYSILEEKFPNKVLSTKGNLNNEFGVPLTLMQLNYNHQVAIIEMGANHLKEIAYLTEIVKPDIAIVTNAGSAHIEGFGSLEKIAQAKGELYSSLPEQAYAVINNDDKYASYWKSQSNIKKENIHTFAIENQADIVAKKNKTSSQSWSIVTAKDEFDLKLPLPGKHNVLNAAAAVTVCKILDVSNEQIKQGLSDFKNISGRLEINKKQKQFTLINDTYNANPESVKAAIDVLVLYQSKQEKTKTVLIFGDMGELGDEAKKLHKQMGEYAAKKNIDVLYAVGDLSQCAFEGFQQVKQLQQQTSESKFFNNLSELNTFLMKIDFNDSVVLVKGSRKMQMEKVVDVMEKLN